MTAPAITTMSCAECGAPLHPSTHQPSCTACHGGRGLCRRCYRRCYRRAYKRGGLLALIDHDRSKRTADEVLDEWVNLRDDGTRWADAAPRLGMTAAALDQVLVRARRRDDPRGLRQPFGRGV